MGKSTNINHHSVADWDWGFASGFRSLQTGWYKSPPTSLKISGDVPWWVGVWLCRHADTLVLPDGELKGWLYREMNAHPQFLFRNQAALGSSNMSNTYYLVGYMTQWQLNRRVNNGNTVIGYMGTCLQNTEEGHFSVKWYSGLNPGSTPALVVELYQEVSPGEWVLQGTLYDTQDKWKDSAINRCGQGYEGAGGNYFWYDDTEIWGPV